VDCPTWTSQTSAGMDWYDSEMSPEDAAREALENEGFHLFVDDIGF